MISDASVTGYGAHRELTTNTSLIDLIAAKTHFKIVATFADEENSILEPPKPTPTRSGGVRLALGSRDTQPPAAQRRVADAAHAACRRPAEAVVGVKRPADFTPLND